MKNRRLFVSFLMASIAGLLFGCGGGDGGKDSPWSDPPATTLLSIDISPSDSSLSLGKIESLSAIGRYSDGTTKDITSAVRWESSDPFIAAVSNAIGSKGSVSCINLGTVALTAMLNDTAGSTNLTVIEATLVSIRITPDVPTIPIGISGGFRLIGTYSDGTSQDITSIASWDTSDERIASIGNTPLDKGILTSVTTGTATITARANNLSSSAKITVSAIQAIATGLDNAFIYFETAVDGNGTAITALTSLFLDKISIFRLKPGDNRATVQSIDVGIVESRVDSPRLAVNDKGDATLVWTGHNGVYACSYLPNIGWGSPQVIAEMEAETLDVGMDGQGNAIVVWSTGTGTGYDIYTSTIYVEGTWGAPQFLGNTDFAYPNLSLAVSNNGDAILLWQNWDWANKGGWKLYATQYFQDDRWEPATVLATGQFGNEFNAAMNDNGVALVAWSNNEVYPSTVNATFFTPDTGWGFPEQIGQKITSTDVSVSMNNSMEGVVCWGGLIYELSAGFDVLANRYSPLEGWQGEEIIQSFPNQSPSKIQVKIDQYGNIVSTWLAPLLDLSYHLEMTKFITAQGWNSPEELWVGVGTASPSYVSNSILSMNANGATYITWAEGWRRWDGQVYKNYQDIYQHRTSTGL